MEIGIRRPLCLICVCLCVLVFIFTGMTGPKPSETAKRMEGKSITITGVIKDKQIKNGNVKLFVEAVHLGENAKEESPDEIKGLIATLNDTNIEKNLHIGQRVKLRGVFQLFETPFNEGQFDARTYYAIRRYEGQLNRSRLLGLSKEYNYLTDNLRRFRDHAYSVLLDSMNEDDAAIVAAMSLGDKSNVEYSDKELYQNAGISHVLALSGVLNLIFGLFEYRRNRDIWAF